MFCTRCGTQIAPGAGFCGGCGLRFDQAAQPPPQQQQQQHQQHQPQTPQMYPAPGAYGSPQPPTGGGTSWVKILAIVLGVFLLLGALAVGGIVWAGFWAKDKIEQKAKASGIDLSKMDEQLPAAKRVEPCSLLTQEEAQKILGVAIERVESSDDRTCLYYAKEGVEKDAEKALEERVRKAGKDTGGIEAAVKGILGDVSDNKGAYMVVSVQWDEGRAAVTAFQLALELLAPDLKTPVSGLGDQALFGPMDSMLIFRKAGTAVVIDLRLVPEGRARGMEIARKIESRLDI